MRNLAPALVRQRVIIEAIPRQFILPPAIEEYLLRLADITKMEVLSGPYIYPAFGIGPTSGYGSWTHWKTSGATFYSYEAPLITLDCYTCKPFDPVAVVEFTRQFFRPVDIEWMEVTR